MLFQFHKGPIKARVSFAYLYQGVCCFNSIKVRLKPFWQRTYCPEISSFNSIKVRLKQGELDKDKLKGMFQFHKGPIKAVVNVSPLLFIMMFQFHKGPIKAIAPPITLLPMPKFQFHKGPIKAQHLTHSHKILVVSIP